MNNYSFETKYYQAGKKYIAGTDEVGRGPLAGPVVASAVIMKEGCYIEGVTDSKKLSEKKRIELKKEIEKKAIAIATVFISEEEIDQINIYEASRLAMIKAIKGLVPKPDIIFSDAMPLNIGIENLPIIKGDQLSFSIACASIVAKVTRDEYMNILDKKYPEYGFAKHKGYPTKAHLEALEKYGVLPIHRKTYSPVEKQLLKEKNNLI